MAIYSSILPWSIPWTKEPGRLQFMGVANSQTQLSTAHSFILDDLAHFQNNVLIIPVILLFQEALERHHYTKSMQTFKKLFGCVQQVGSQISDQKLSPCSLRWDDEVLIIGSPGKSPVRHLKINLSSRLSSLFIENIFIIYIYIVSSYMI